MKAVLLVAMISLAPASAFAQAKAKFTFEGVANCTRPALQNYPITGEGTGTLSTDRSAKLDMNSNVEGAQTYDVTLGGKPIVVPGGSAALRVVNRRTLRAIRDYPNNILIVDLTVTKSRCTLKLTHQLKPGKREYTFQTYMGLAYCDKPTITKTECGEVK